MNEKQKGFLALLGAAVIYSFYGFFIRSLDVMYGNYSQIVVRFLTAWIILLIIDYFSKNKKKLTWQDKKLSIYMGILGGVATIFFVIAMINIKIADVIFMFYVGGVVTAFVLGTLIYKEKVNFQKIIMVVTVLLGLFTYVEFSVNITAGIIMALFSGAVIGVVNVIRKKLKEADRYQVLKMQFVSMIPLVLMVMFVFYHNEPIIKEISIFSIISTVLYAIALIKVSDLTLYGLAKYDVNVGTVVLASEVFFTAIVGYVFLNEALSFYEIIGGGMIFCAAIIGGVDFTRLFKKVRLKDRK